MKMYLNPSMCSDITSKNKMWAESICARDLVRRKPKEKVYSKT